MRFVGVSVIVVVIVFLGYRTLPTRITTTITELVPAVIFDAGMILCLSVEGRFVQGFRPRKRMVEINSSDGPALFK